MKNKEFTDYYKLLQVHYDASPEVIKAAYLKLTKAYHPDSSSAFSDGISALNEAFAVLKDAKLRDEYHQEWVAHYTGRKNPMFSEGVVPADTTLQAAKDTLDLFFRYLCIREWDGAYQLLTSPDKRKTSLEDFSAWREAVALCSEIASYSLHYSRSMANCKIDGVTYGHVMEFTADITEVNAITGETGCASVKKICVHDGISWHVFLGVSNAKALALRFRLEAEHGRSIDSMALYHSAVSRIDALTGLLSEQGFLEECEKESDRMRRYRNPVTLAAFRAHCPKERETACICQLAAIIRDSKRRSDSAARLNNDIIVCLLTETKKTNADLAARKFLRLIDRKKTEDFTVSYGVFSYTDNITAAQALKQVSSLADTSL